MATPPKLIKTNEDVAVIPSSSADQERAAVQTSSKSSDLTQSNSPMEDSLKLFGDEEFTDFTFSVSGTDFPVHKVIVSARCAVFDAMFRNDMKEKSENRAVIEGISPEAFKEVLSFIYTGEVGNIMNLAGDLVEAADKYDLAGLKKRAEDELFRSICPENATIILQLADKFSCAQLKTKTINYIVENVKDIFESDAWKQLLSSTKTELVGEVFSSFVRFSEAKYLENQRVISQKIYDVFTSL